MLGGSSSSFDNVGADDVAEWGDIGTEDGRETMSAVVHVGENRGAVLDVVLGERVAVAS